MSKIVAISAASGLLTKNTATQHILKAMRPPLQEDDDNYKVLKSLLVRSMFSEFRFILTEHRINL